MQDFEAELEKAEREEEEKKEDSGELPGWGSWAGEGAPKPKPRLQPKAKAKEEPRKPKPSHFSVYDGKMEASKYFVDQLPYGVKNPAQYNQELRMPTTFAP